MDEERKEPRSAMTTDLAPFSRLTREIRELQQLGHCEHLRAALSLAQACGPLRAAIDDVRLWDAS
jgi:hypothetical protein